MSFGINVLRAELERERERFLEQYPLGEVLTDQEEQEMEAADKELQKFALSIYEKEKAAGLHN